MNWFCVRGFVTRLLVFSKVIICGIRIRIALQIVCNLDVPTMVQSHIAEKNPKEISSESCEVADRNGTSLENT